MKVLLVNGSPNEKGCTYTALSEVASALNAQGIDTEFFQIGKKPVPGCIACGTCSTKGSCVFGDRATELAEKARECDGFVIGSPVYYAGLNGSLKSLLDRAFFSCGSPSPFRLKPAAAVASARRAGTTPTLDEINKYFQIAQMPVVSGRYWNMVHGKNPDEVRRDEEGLQNMRILGKNMAWLLKSIEAGAAAGLTPPEPETTVFTNFIR